MSDIENCKSNKCGTEKSEKVLNGVLSEVLTCKTCGKEEVKKLNNNLRKKT